jgi:hypothetical protein
MPDYLLNHYSSMVGNTALRNVHADESDNYPGIKTGSGIVNMDGSRTNICKRDNRSDSGYVGNSETVLLSDFMKGEEPVRARLISMEDRNEKPHLLTADEYRIGKSEFASDIVLPSEAVSRLHAKLIWKEDHYELRDMRSKNATFINETMVDAGEDIVLKDGDCCRFADLVYRYRTGAADAV